MKNKVFRIIISLLFLLLFNVLFFVIGDSERSSVDWLSYAFITVAYLLLLSTPLFYSSKKGLAVLEYTMYFNATVYFFVELVVGIIFILIQPGRMDVVLTNKFLTSISYLLLNHESYVWPLVIQSILLVIFLVIQFSSAVANNATQASIEKQRSESVAIKSLAEKIRLHMRDIQDITLRKKVEQCYEDINNASIETFPEAEEAELALRNAVEMLCLAIEDEDVNQIEKKARRVSNVLADRNAIIRRCRLSN